MTMMQQATARTYERDAFYDRNGGFNKAPLWERLHWSVTARPTTRHPNFPRHLKILGLITMVGVSANLAMPMGKAQAGGFGLTCNNDRLHVVNLLGLHLGTLAANCLGVGPFGLPGDSVIELNEHITNDDGTLKYSP